MLHQRERSGIRIKNAKKKRKETKFKKNKIVPMECSDRMYKTAREERGRVEGLREQLIPLLGGRRRRGKKGLEGNEKAGIGSSGCCCELL